MRWKNGKEFSNKISRREQREFLVTKHLFSNKFKELLCFDKPERNRLLFFFSSATDKSHIESEFYNRISFPNRIKLPPSQTNWLILKEFCKDSPIFRRDKEIIEYFCDLCSCFNFLCIKWISDR